MNKSITDIITAKCIQEIMDQEDAALLEILGEEPPLNYIKTMLNREDKRKYICRYIREHSYFRNLRFAVQEVCPEHEDMLDKLLVLK